MRFSEIMSILVLLFAVTACHSGSKKSRHTSLFTGQKPDSVFRPKYAKGFSISYFDCMKLIEVKDPWDDKAPASVFLVGPENMAKRFKGGAVPFVSLPVGNWSCFSSTQVVFADKLGVLETLKSVAEPQYISDPRVQKRLKSGHIHDVGLASAPDLEVLIASDPQFIFVSPFRDTRYESLTEAGLLVIPDAGYLEQSPLGRAEWVVLFSAFFNKENVAGEVFRDIEQQYYSVREDALKSLRHPSVITGTLYQDVWYLPAGNSFMAQLLADAGTLYPYRDEAGTGSLALDFESVFNEAWESDYWVITVNHSNEFRAGDFLEMDDRYGDFSAFKNGHVLFTNSAYSQFFEKGVLEPHVILKDMASLMHPGLFPGYRPHYFEFLQK